MQQVQARKQHMISGALTDQEVRTARIEELKMLFRWISWLNLFWREGHALEGFFCIGPKMPNFVNSGIVNGNLVLLRQWLPCSTIEGIYRGVSYRKSWKHLNILKMTLLSLTKERCKSSQHDNRDNNNCGPNTCQSYLGLPRSRIDNVIGASAVRS